LGVQIYKIFYSWNPLQEIIPGEAEETVDCIVSSRWHRRKFQGFWP
jgi:hypothetical protein